MQPLVQHTDTVLLTLDSLADNVCHAAGTDRQLLLTRCQLFRQTAQLNLHLFNGFNRIVGTNNILTNTFAQMLVNGHKELDFTFRAFRIFRQTQYVAQMFVIRDGQAQRAQRLIRHGAQFIRRQISQLTTVQTAFHAIVFHHPHDCAPAGFRGHNLLAHFMIIALQLAQLTGQVLHLRFAEGERFLKLIATRTVIAQLGVQFIATLAGTLFRPAVGANANIL